MMGSAIVAAPAAAQDVIALLRVISDPKAAEEALHKIELAQAELRGISAKIDDQHNSVNNAMLDLADRTKAVEERENEVREKAALTVTKEGQLNSGVIAFENRKMVLENGFTKERDELNCLRNMLEQHAKDLDARE